MRLWKLWAIPAMLVATGAGAESQCSAVRATPLLPSDPGLCAELEATIRDPSALALNEYEARLDRYFGHYCHRNAAVGWVRDKRVRSTGPFTAALADGRWTGAYHGTHASVVIWYSPEMADWLRTNRSGQPSDVAVPDGAVMVKEMFVQPAEDCAGIDPARLFPEAGAAVMVRDSGASHDGWFWGWYGFGADSGWAPDWPAAATNPLPNMGFAQYCMNCHASASSDVTFASPRNIEGEPGEPLVYLSQNFYSAPPESHHRTVALPHDDIDRLGMPHLRRRDTLAAELRAYLDGGPDWDTVTAMPSQTYDEVFVSGGVPDASSTFLTSSQCLGCHDAGSTGLQFDMTRPQASGPLLENLSPYATWRSSPMGLAGRDPFFFAQLASETETFHPESAALVEDTCLGCHGVQGQRQFHIDGVAGTGACADFSREMVDAVPYPGGRTRASDYGALARDGISCTSCHRMELGASGAESLMSQPQNACVEERQEFLNPDNTGFARTFTGSFLVGAPDRLIGPFENPREAPMKTAIGNMPEHDAAIEASELCGTCHTVHLPVMRDGEVIGRTYEQTTYGEWAFSAYRTGSTVDGPLPFGAGSSAESCQSCHMRSTEPDGTPTRSKIASIQEFSTFMETENVLPGSEIDLEVREGFARHTLVGLNVFLIKMAQQFPDILGIRTADPMLGDGGVAPLMRTEQAILDQASDATAEIEVSDLVLGYDTLSATVAITNKAGHKVPSGVGFRRAFVEFRVIDASGQTLWASGRTNASGVLVDANGAPVAGEYWWTEDCSARIAPLERRHQPHYETITGEQQVQIYQELVSTPPLEDGPATCGQGAEPAGQLTTSFLSICARVKDNRLLPHGTLPLGERIEIAHALGAGAALAEDAGPVAVGQDPDYVSGGGDRIRYEIPLADLSGGRAPAAVEATLFYQATPPYYLQDRFCTSESDDTDRLAFMVSHLNLDGSDAAEWKLEIVSTGPVAIP